jgi:hypothetical protein
MRPENLAQFTVYRVIVCKLVDKPVKHNALLNPFGIIELLPSFNIITDHVPCQYRGVTERKICVGKVVHHAIYEDADTVYPVAVMNGSVHAF